MWQAKQADSHDWVNGVAQRVLVCELLISHRDFGQVVQQSVKISIYFFNKFITSVNSSPRKLIHLLFLLKHFKVRQAIEINVADLVTVIITRRLVIL
jgi:hypothetical protein